MSTARDSIFFLNTTAPQVSELRLATLVGTLGLSCPLGISSFFLCLFDLMTKLVQSKWLNIDLTPKNCSKNLSQYPIKPTEQVSSRTLCLQYRFKVHREQCSTCTSIHWSQRATINVIIYDDSLLGDWGKSSFPRMHMAYSSYTPFNSSVLAAFSPFSCFGFLCGGSIEVGRLRVAEHCTANTVQTL